jgi:hypothetical protein
MGGGDHVAGLIPETLQQIFAAGRPFAQSPLAALLGEFEAETAGDEATSAILILDGYQVVVAHPVR